MLEHGQEAALALAILVVHHAHDGLTGYDEVEAVGRLALPNDDSLERNPVKKQTNTRSTRPSSQMSESLTTVLLVEGTFADLLLHVDRVLGEGGQLLQSVSHELDLLIGARFGRNGQDELHFFADLGLPQRWSVSSVLSNKRLLKTRDLPLAWPCSGLC